MKYLPLLLPVAAYGAGLDDAFAAMDKTAQQFRSVTTDLKRDVYTAVIDDHDRDMGVMKARREKSHDMVMLIELTSPVQKFISVDGAQVTVYTPKTKTAQVYDVKRGLAEQFLLLGFGAPSSEVREHYDVTFIAAEKVGSELTWHLQLIPKSPDVLKNLKKAELWIGQNSGLPVQEKLFTSGSGDYELIDYSNVKLNPSLSDKDVKLNLPKGVTVEHPKL